MKIVVDTSAIIAVIANEPEKTALIELTRGAELIAPRSVHWEIGNAFSTMLKRKKITAEETSKALEVYGRIPIRFLDVDLKKSLEIAHELALYAYDAYLIRCAQKYRAPLVSLDRNLVASAKKIGVQVREVD